MVESKELAIHQDAGPIASVMGISPKAMLDGAVEIANDLTLILRKKNLTQKFGAGEHCLVEGWQLAGSMLGFTVRESTLPIEHADGSFTAVAELFHPASGRVVATASGYCGKDEKTWGSKPKYARRSMAVTRAIGRVYRNNFAWIIKMAGFSTSLAEEMEVAPPTEEQRAMAETYDPTQEHHKRWLLKQFEVRHVPKDLWSDISTKFSGKPKSEIITEIARLTTNE